ncbi:MAG: hypothetical protein Q8N39_06540 [Pelolinea sp.]|nr:hypothetical protein [Pelolinea sp.]
MKISNNNRLIQRNKRISQIVLYSALALLVIGLIWSFTGADRTQYTIAYIILIPAYILVQISIYLANKWGRSPRPDEIIGLSLKGLNDQYTLYNYNTGVPHLLVGPAGVWIINPYHQIGIITYNSGKNRYEQKGGANFIAKLFGQESLSNIEKESKIARRVFEDYKKKNNISFDVEPKIVNIFFSEKADVNAKNAPEITIHSDKLKEMFRSQAKLNLLRDEKINQIRSQLPDPN